MKRTVLLFLFLPFFFASNCKKEECISGTVSDSKTGKPVSGAILGLYYYYDDLRIQKTAYSKITSDDSGAFYSCADYDGFGISVYSVYKHGYARGFKGTDKILLTPLDGLLKLKITNETGTHDTIRVSVFNKCDYKYPWFGGGYLTNPHPLILQPGETHTETFAACAGDSSNVQWWTSYLSSYVGVDSLWIKTGDTTYYHLKY